MQHKLYPSFGLAHRQPNPKPKTYLLSSNSVGCQSSLHNFFTARSPITERCRPRISLVRLWFSRLVPSPATASVPPSPVRAASSVSSTAVHDSTRFVFFQPPASAFVLLLQPPASAFTLLLPASASSFSSGRTSARVPVGYLITDRRSARTSFPLPATASTTAIASTRPCSPSGSVAWSRRPPPPPLFRLLSALPHASCDRPDG